MTGNDIAAVVAGSELSVAGAPVPIPRDAFEQAADVLARHPWCPDCGLRLQLEQPRSDRLHPPRRGPDGEALYPVLRRCPRNAERPAIRFEPAFVVGGVRYEPVCDYAQVVGYAPARGGLTRPCATILPSCGASAAR